MYFDELSDEEAEYYNERIGHFENGDYEGTRKVDLKITLNYSLINIILLHI